MAKLADAADLKSAGPKGLWGFDSPSRHQLTAALRAKWAWIFDPRLPEEARVACGLLRRV